MKSLPGKIAVVQVSSGASCNASLPSTGQGLLCAALGGAIDYRLDAGRFKALPAVSVWSDFDDCHRSPARIGINGFEIKHHC